MLLSPTRAPGAAQKVALLPLENRASDTYQQFVTDMTVILMDSLRGRGRIAVIGETQVSTAMQELAITPGKPLSPPLSAKVGGRVGADWVIQGSFLDIYRIDARCADAKTGEPVLDQAVTGKRDEVIDLVGELGRGLLTGLSAGSAKTVAILPFVNRASEEYRPFVRGISDMLVTVLEASETLTLIERTQVGQAVQKFRLPMDEVIDRTTVVEIGNGLGVDLVIHGSFLETYQLDAQLIDVREMKLVGESSVKGGRSDTTGMVGQLVTQLFEGLTTRVAVLDLENRASDHYQAFVRAISDTLSTRLRQAEQITVIERGQIEKALRHVAFPSEGPLSPEHVITLGKWLGADAMVLGSFARFGKTFLIDARLVDVRTGELLTGQSVKGEEEAVRRMIDQIGRSLLESLIGKIGEPPGQTGTLEINVQVDATPMTERRIFHHLCRVYVDGTLMGESPVVKREDGRVTIFSQALRAGPHKVEVVHGYVGKKDQRWAGKLDRQPKIFQVTIEPNAAATISYTYHVGWFSDQYEYTE